MNSKATSMTAMHKADSMKAEWGAVLKALAGLLEYPGAEFDSRIEKVRTALRRLAAGPELNVPSPLTPALSLRERENDSPPAGQGVATKTLRPSICEPTDGDDDTNGNGATSLRPLLFPLPGGEGQGERKERVHGFKPIITFERFRNSISTLSADAREELYTGTFDVTPACVAYVSIHLFGEENFKRGEFMAALNARYEQSAFDCGGELPDHLSVLLRFAATFHEDERRELTQFCLLGPIEKMIASQTPDNPYRALLETVREVFQAAYPGMKPALSPWEQMQQHGAGCAALTAGCGCNLLWSDDDAPPAEGRIRFGVPPSGGPGVVPPEGGTPNGSFPTNSKSVASQSGTLNPLSAHSNELPG